MLNLHLYSGKKKKKKASAEIQTVINVILTYQVLFEELFSPKKGLCSPEITFDQKKSLQSSLPAITKTICKAAAPKHGGKG